MSSFRALGVSEELCAALAAQGIKSPFPIQSLTIADALAGRDVCGKARTGSGKTLAFAVPVVQRTQRATKPKCPSSLVLVPTRELASQVESVVKPLAEAAGLRSLVCYGGKSINIQAKALRAGVDIVIATPGRATDLIQRGEMSCSEIKLVVLDEADRMTDMGFLPAVEWFLRRLEGPAQLLLFSATLDGSVARLVSRYLQDPVTHEVAGEEPTVESMQHRFLGVHQMDRDRLLASIVRSSERTIVFTRTKRGADKLARNLAKLGVDVVAMHGDVPQAKREKALASFAAGKAPALIATDVMARGIHVDGVDVVVHYDPPADEKDYLHRSGRTARAGASGVAVSLLLWNEHFAAEMLMRRLGLRCPIVEMFSNDPRLADLAAWDPAPQLQSA